MPTNEYAMFAGAYFSAEKIDHDGEAVTALFIQQYQTEKQRRGGKAEQDTAAGQGGALRLTSYWLREKALKIIEPDREYQYTIALHDEMISRISKKYGLTENMVFSDYNQLARTEIQKASEGLQPGCLSIPF